MATAAIYLLVDSVLGSYCYQIGAFLCCQSDQIEILLGLHSFLARQKLPSAIGLAMFCKQRRFGTPRAVHHTKSWLKLSFYRSIQIYRVDFEKMYNISSMLFFFSFFFNASRLCGKRTKKGRDLCMSPGKVKVKVTWFQSSHKLILLLGRT